MHAPYPWVLQLVNKHMPSLGTAAFELSCSEEAKSSR